MKIRQISILKHFHCTGAVCPSNCCRGWKIPIDDDAYEKYITEKGFFGFLLRCFLVKKEELTSFRCSKRQYRCPFWGFDHLCSLQKNHGTDYMPRVCVEFPRQLSNFGTFCEETLYLACHEAARLFLEQARAGIPFAFTETTGTANYEENTTNDDLDFLGYLLKSRDELITMLTNGCGLSISLLTYAKDTQDKCLAYYTQNYGAPNTSINLGSEQFALPSPLSYFSSENTPFAQSKPFTVNASTMHTLFFKGFYHPSLRHSSPVLYKICQKYIREFYTLTKSNPAQADKKLDALLERVYDYVPDFDALMTSYYIYYLQKNFLDIYEDYCFLKHMLCGMAQVQMLKLFITLYCKERYGKKSAILPTDELALIIAVYERRAPQIEDAILLISSPLPG